MTVQVSLSLLLLAILWGSAFPAIQIALRDLDPGHLTLLRFVVASACFVPMLKLSGSRMLPARRDLGYFLLLGFTGISFYHSALNYGQTRVSAGAASLIIATAPAITAILASFMLRDRLPWLGWVGIALSFTGVALISLGENAGLTLNPFALLILLAALATSLYAIWQKPLFGRYRALEVTSFATWAGTLPLFIFSPGLGEKVLEAPWQSLAAAVYTGIFPAAIAYVLFSYALSRADVTVVTPYLYSVPVFSMLFAWLLLAEVPPALTLAGGLLALAGIALVNYAKRRALLRLRLAAKSLG